MAQAYALPYSRRSFDPRWLALGVTSIGSFMSILDSTIVNVALPDILKDFGASLETGQLVLTVYLLALAVVIPLCAFLSARVGMKRLYMITLVCFTAGSALCGLAWNLPSLVGFRAIQGLGGGLLQPLGMAIVYSMITPLERGRFMVMLGLPLLLAPLLGPTLGGYLAQYVSWRMIFLINLPIGALNLYLAWILLKEPARLDRVSFDGHGFLLALFAFPSLLLLLSEGDVLGWTSLSTFTLAGIGLAALAGFIVVELRRKQPLLQIRYFRHPIFAVTMGVAFVTQFSLFGIQYLLPLMLQQARGLGAAATGLILLPSGITSFLSMTVAGQLYNRAGPKKLAFAGLTVLLVTTLLFARTDASTSLMVLAILASLRGVAIGFAMMPVNTAAFNTVPDGQMAHATALTNVLFRIFASTGAAILTATLVVSLQLRGAPSGASVTSGTAPTPLLFHAFDDAFLLMAGVTLVGIVLSWFVRDVALDEMRRRRALGMEESEPVREHAALAME
jgi:EmrB/QacA subfamily drug resistance transporter